MDVLVSDRPVDTKKVGVVEDDSSNKKDDDSSVFGKETIGTKEPTSRIIEVIAIGRKAEDTMSDTDIFLPGGGEGSHEDQDMTTQNQWKQYDEYDVAVDTLQDDKARQIKLCSLQRPHMRAFHASWWSFFVAFFIWFCITPLLSEIRVTLQISTKDIWTSSIVNALGTTIIRIILGPLCDMYGARILSSACLCVAAIPTALTGLIQDSTGLMVLRFFISIAGGVFVTCQYWCTVLFTKEVVGTANATAAGWGNLGGGVTQLVIGTLLFPWFQSFWPNETPIQAAENAWRTVCIVPAVVAFITGVVVLFTSDDCPKGNYKDLKKHGTMHNVSFTKSFFCGGKDFNTWLLFIQYACCFGVEVTMTNAAALYFRDQFGQSTSSAAAIASIFGWMNLFARAFGGMISDWAYSRWGMRGRLWTQVVTFLGEGMMVLIFSNTGTLSGSIVVMIIFSLFVQAAEGSTYGIVPYVNEEYVGSITGFVGAGGSAGAIGFGLAFRQLDYHKAFLLMGIIILESTILTALITIRGYANLLWGEDTILSNKDEVFDDIALDKFEEDEMLDG